LGYIYDGGPKQDYYEVYVWYRKAAQNGDSYYHGRGVPENMKSAMYWFKKSVQNDGNKDAQKYIHMMQH
jgi:TPR repeat protein